MTSKEALERVKTAPEYCGEKSVYKKYDNSYIPFMNDIELIEKDLEVLELIRKLFVFDEYMGFDIDFRKLKESEKNKVKEWLNDNNGND